MELLDERENLKKKIALCGCTSWQGSSMGAQPSHEQTEEEKLFNVCARRTTITVPGNKCFLFGVVGAVVATAIFVPYPTFNLWHRRRVYPMLLTGALGILADDYLMSKECEEFARMHAAAGRRHDEVLRANLG